MRSSAYNRSWLCLMLPSTRCADPPSTHLSLSRCSWESPPSAKDHFARRSSNGKRETRRKLRLSIRRTQHSRWTSANVAEPESWNSATKERGPSCSASRNPGSVGKCAERESMMWSDRRRDWDLSGTASPQEQPSPSSPPRSPHISSPTIPLPYHSRSASHAWISGKIPLRTIRCSCREKSTSSGRDVFRRSLQCLHGADCGTVGTAQSRC